MKYRLGDERACYCSQITAGAAICLSGFVSVIDFTSRSKQYIIRMFISTTETYDIFVVAIIETGIAVVFSVSVIACRPWNLVLGVYNRCNGWVCQCIYGDEKPIKFLNIFNICLNTSCTSIPMPRQYHMQYQTLRFIPLDLMIAQSQYWSHKIKLIANQKQTEVFMSFLCKIHTSS